MYVGIRLPRSSGILALRPQWTGYRDWLGFLCCVQPMLCIIWWCSLVAVTVEFRKKWAPNSPRLRRYVWGFAALEAARAVELAHSRGSTMYGANKWKLERD